MKLKQTIKKTVKITAICLGALFVIGLIGATLDETNVSPEASSDKTVSEHQNSSSEKSPQLTAEIEKDPKALFKTAKDFRSSFNAFCGDNSFDMSIPEITVQEGSVNNTFNVNVTENVGLVGAVDRASGNVNDIMVIGSTNGQTSSVIEIFASIGAVIGSVDPTLTPTQRGKILADLGMLDKNTDLTDHSAKIDTNGFHYTINCSNITGIIFTVAKS